MHKHMHRHTMHDTNTTNTLHTQPHTHPPTHIHTGLDPLDLQRAMMVFFMTTCPLTGVHKHIWAHIATSSWELVEVGPNYSLHKNRNPNQNLPLCDLLLVAVSCSY